MHPKRITRFALIFLLCNLLSFSLRAQSACSTAVALNSPDDNYVNVSTSSQEAWYTFTATSLPQLNLWLFNNSADGFTAVTLYSGTCSSLTPVATGVSVGLDYNLLYTSLNNGTTYFIKANRTLTSSVTYNLNAVFSAVGSAPCPCPAALYDPNNTCEAVCNGGFDYNTGSLNNWSQIHKACPWSAAPNVNGYLGASTTDLFAANGTTPFDVPANDCGNQASHSNAASAQAGYGGIICYSNNNAYPNGYREYLEVQLNSPLVAGQSYALSFWISLADNAGWTVKNIGAFVKQGQILQNVGQTWMTIPAGAPNILYTSNVTNDATWMQISGTITANGGEDHLIIGQFTDNISCGNTYHAPAITNGTNSFAYYFIDDVSLKPNASFTISANPNPACQGTPISLIAMATGSNGTYTWTASSGTFTCFGSGCPIINTTATGASYTATTVLASYGGCTTTQSYTPTLLPAPTSVNAGANQTVCVGGTVTLTGTSTGNCTNSSWSVLNGSPFITAANCNLSVGVSPTQNTTYVFTAWNSQSNCSMTDTVTVTVYTIPVQIVVAPGATTCGGSFQFTTIPATFSSYVWTTNATSSSGNNTSTLTASWGSSFSGPGTVTVVVHDVNGCVATATVAVPECCLPSSGSYLFTNDSSSHMNTTYAGFATWNVVTQTWDVTQRVFSINGIFKVNQNTKIIACNIKMGANAKIILSPGVTFELTYLQTPLSYTYISSCKDMWDGIYVDGTNSATHLKVLNGTVIEDALNAVVSTKGGRFTIDGAAAGLSTYNKLNKNNIGVLVRPYAGVHPGVIRRTIVSCDAPGQTGSTTGLTSTGPNCKAPINTIGAYGVFLDSVNTFTVGDSVSNTYRNLFERTKIGVYSKKCNLFVWNNDFKYYTTNVMTPTMPVNGIAVYAVGQNSLVRTATVGRAGLYKAKNKFVKCDHAVFAYNYINFKCEFNRFDTCAKRAIYGLNLRNVTVNINYDTLKECAGTNISVVECSGSTVNIRYNGLSQTSTVPSNFGQTGVYVANAVLSNANVYIQYNKIQKMRNGIWVTRVKRPVITDNSPITFIAGQPFTLGNPARGIVIQNTQNALVRMNTINSSITASSTNYDKLMGIYVQNSQGDTISKNTITSCGSGVFCNGADNPSLFGCNNFTACYYAFNFSYVNGQNPSVGVSINNQFLWSNSQTITPTGNTFTGSNSDLKGRIAQISGNGIKWYYNGTAPTNGTQIGSLWGGAPISTSNASQCANLLAPSNSSDPTLRTYLLFDICVTPRTYDTLQDAFQYNDKVYAYQMLSDNPSWLSLGTADDTSFQNFYTAESTTNIGKFASVEQAIQSGNLSSASSQLAAIMPSDIWETNRKTVLEIFIQSWAAENFELSDSQNAALFTIANQHPITGGTAVVDARVMLNLEANDSSSVRMGQVQQDPVSVGSAYPNPSTGQISIPVALPEGQRATFEVFDMAGRSVAAWPFIGGQSVYTFDLGQLPEGLYFYRVISGNEALKADRILIIRED